MYEILTVLQRIIEDLNPILQALIATLFTWGTTALGSSFVFITKTANRKLLDSSLGFAAGVMIATSYWSLLAPSIEMSKESDLPIWLAPSIGFLLGSFFLFSIDKIIPHLHQGFPIEEKEGIKISANRITLLILAITLHNIPEGLAVGVSFGAASQNFQTSTLIGAIILAIGIGIQNFPEGMAVSMPLKNEGFSNLKCFWYGQLSAIVEPLAAVLGAVLVNFFKLLLPYALSFAAGAMIFVVVEEVIPESQKSKNTDLATISTIFGFVLMMLLDVIFV